MRHPASRLIQWRDLSDAERDSYDEARINYHSELVVVATSTIRDVARQGRLLTLLNRREISARRGLIVSGLQTTGKSTALKELGRTHELMVRAKHPRSDRIPVVYVTTPPKGSPRKLAMEFARLLGLPPIRRSYNATDISDSVCQILIDARVELVLVDEIHNLNLATSAGEDMSDHLKYFAEHLPATLVSPGINVERSGLFTGVRGGQIAGRCWTASRSITLHNPTAGAWLDHRRRHWDVASFAATGNTDPQRDHQFLPGQACRRESAPPGGPAHLCHRGEAKSSIDPSRTHRHPQRSETHHVVARHPGAPGPRRTRPDTCSYWTG
jgi:hypothetical protein